MLAVVRGILLSRSGPLHCLYLFLYPCLLLVIGVYDSGVLLKKKKKKAHCELNSLWVPAGEVHMTHYMIQTV